MKNFLYFLFLIILHNGIYGQCSDSVMIKVTSSNHDNEGWNLDQKSVTHYTASGKISDVTNYSFDGNRKYPLLQIVLQLHQSAL